MPFSWLQSWTGSRITGEILADSERTRDAAFFVKGYNIAYNDWASRTGSWMSSDELG